MRQHYIENNLQIPRGKLTDLKAKFKGVHRFCMAVLNFALNTFTPRGECLLQRVTSMSQTKYEENLISKKHQSYETNFYK